MVSKWITVIAKMDCEKEYVYVQYFNDQSVRLNMIDAFTIYIPIWKLVLNITTYVSILPFFLFRGSRNICTYDFLLEFRCKGSPLTLRFFSKKCNVETASCPGL